MLMVRTHLAWAIWRVFSLGVFVIICVVRGDMAEGAQSTIDKWREDPVPLEERLITIDWRRVRFTLCVGLYGGSLGVAAILIHLLSQVPYPNTPEHLPPLKSFVFSTGGFAAGALLTAPFAYWIHRPRYVQNPERHRDPRGALLWFVLGVFYGIVMLL